MFAGLLCKAPDFNAGKHSRIACESRTSRRCPTNLGVYRMKMPIRGTPTPGQPAGTVRGRGQSMWEPRPTTRALNFSKEHNMQAPWLKIWGFRRIDSNDHPADEPAPDPQKQEPSEEVKAIAKKILE